MKRYVTILICCTIAIAPFPTGLLLIDAPSAPTRLTVTGYNRAAAFGPGWATGPRGCNSREIAMAEAWDQPCELPYSQWGNASGGAGSGAEGGRGHGGAGGGAESGRSGAGGSSEGGRSGNGGSSEGGRGGEVGGALARTPAPPARVEPITDPYTGEDLLPADVEIDHIFPLSAAWDMGAYAWPQEKRLAFANDPLNLVVTSSRANQAKSDSLPSEWMPPARRNRCDYSRRLAAVASKYQLAIPREDRRVMRRSCAGFAGLTSARIW